MSNSSPKYVYSRIVKTGQNVMQEDNNDYIKLNARITPPTRPISIKTKMLTSPTISDNQWQKKGDRNGKKSQSGKGKKKKEKETLKVGAWNMPVAATQPHIANVNLTNHTLEEEKLDILGLIECNI